MEGRLHSGSREEERKEMTQGNGRRRVSFCPFLAMKWPPAAEAYALTQPCCLVALVLLHLLYCRAMEQQSLCAKASSPASLPSSPRNR